MFDVSQFFNSRIEYLWSVNYDVTLREQYGVSFTLDPTWRRLAPGVRTSGTLRREKRGNTMAENHIANPPRTVLRFTLVKLDHLVYPATGTNGGRIRVIYVGHVCISRGAKWRARGCERKSRIRRVGAGGCVTLQSGAHRTFTYIVARLITLVMWYD